MAIVSNGLGCRLGAVSSLTKLPPRRFEMMLQFMSTIL